MDIDGMRRPRVRPSIDGIQTAPTRQKTNTYTKSNLRVTPRSTRLKPVPVAERKQFPLPKYYAPGRPVQVTRKRVSIKKLVIRAASLCAVVLVAMGGFLTWNAYVKLHKVFHGSSTVAALASKPVTPNLLKGEGDGRVNILLLGIGGPGHDGPDLTDTIVLFSVDPVNNTAAMLSIPRDIWIKQPVNYFGAYQKINAVYESGKYHYLGKTDASGANANAIEAGFSSIDQAVKAVTGVNVNYHVLVNFQAFRQAIDAVGGVTVNVTTPLVDPTMAWENHWNPVLAPAGVQQMNGVQSLLYARSRETTSDFARGQRQRQILVALKDKVLTAGTLSNPTKIDALMNAFGDNVYSDLSTEGASRLYGIMKKVGDNKIESIGLTDPPHQLITTDHVGSISVDRPTAGFNNYTAIQDYIRSQLPDGYLLKEHAPITVMGPTAAAAAATATMLESYGYNVTATATTNQIVMAPTVIDLSADKYPFTKHYLESRYNTKALNSLPRGISVPDHSASFVVLTGK